MAGDGGGARPDAMFALPADGPGYQAFKAYRDADPNTVIVPFGPDQVIGLSFAFKSEAGSGKLTIAGLGDPRAPVAGVGSTAGSR